MILKLLDAGKPRHDVLCAIRSVALLLTIGASAVASALPTQSWNGYRWGRVGAITISVGNNYTANWAPFVTTALRQWSVANAISLTSVAGRTTSSACSMVYGSIQLCSGNYGATGWTGYTNVQTSNGYIVQATIRLNDYYFNRAFYNNDAWRAETVCQELGNSLGLDDSNRDLNNANTGSCTDYSRDPSGTLGTNGTLANLQPSASDLINLNAIYATAGGRQIVASGVYGNANAAVPEPASWAMLVGGFGLVGGVARRRRSVTVAA
jgi:hypothetical protein